MGEWGIETLAQSILGWERGEERMIVVEDISCII